MESTLPNYAPSILPLDYPSKSHFLTLVLNGKNVDLLVSEFLLCCDSSVRFFFRQSVRGFASLQYKFHFDSMYGVLFRNTERQKKKKSSQFFWVIG